MIVIVSRHPELTDKWQLIIDKATPVHIANSWLIAAALLKSIPISLLVIDTDELLDAEMPTISWIKAHNPTLNILILGNDDSDEAPINAMKEGAHGYCVKTCSDSEFKMAIHAMVNGEAWLPRELIPKLIDELASYVHSSQGPVQPPSKEQLGSLSEREQEVVQLVCQGENNKTIARHLDITERTVKAHIGAIFKKLSVSSRLQLALIFRDFPVKAKQSL